MIFHVFQNDEGGHNSPIGGGIPCDKIPCYVDIIKEIDGLPLPANWGEEIHLANLKRQKSRTKWYLTVT